MGLENLTESEEDLEEDYADNCILYPCTNESIPAVLAGLDLRKDNVVVSIGGSGDIPFAVAPHVSKVFAVERDMFQLDTIWYQQELLEAGNFNEFYGEVLLNYPGSRRDFSFLGHDVRKEHVIARKKYFESRVDETKEAAGRVEVFADDILNFMAEQPKNSVDRVYFSNAIGSYEADLFDSSGFAAAMKCVRPGGIVYRTAKHCEVQEGVPTPLGFKVEPELSEKALEIQRKEWASGYHWIPKVYRKVVA